MSSTSELIISALDETMEKVRTRSLDVSFNELMDMHRTGELIITPDYQRLFRWSEGAQSRFVESILLEMPVPPIYAVEKDDGIYELIDGLQRISSYLHFRGAHPLRTNADGSPHHLVLCDCDIVVELNGLAYEALPTALQIKLKRHFVRVEVIRKESNSKLKYYMFKRLNTGGEPLSDQEVRNCTIRLLDNGFNDFIITLSKYGPFRTCIEPLSEEKLEERYDQELVLRFFAFKNYRHHYTHEVGEFMTNYMELVSDPESQESFDYEKEAEVFRKTFDVLQKTLGSNAFCARNDKGSWVSRFLSYHYEAVTLGLQKHLGSVDASNQDQLVLLKSCLEATKADPEFKDITTGGGKNYAQPLAERIDFVTRALEAVL